MSLSSRVDPQGASDMRPHSFSGLAMIVDRNSRGTGASRRMTRVEDNVGVRRKDHVRQSWSEVGVMVPAFRPLHRTRSADTAAFSHADLTI